MSESALASMIERIRAVRTLGGPEALTEIAREVNAELDASAAAGTTPDGAPWAPRKDGGRPMVNAPDAVAAAVVGDGVLVVLRGNEVFHHFGVRGAPARHVIPAGALPGKLGQAIQRGLVQPWRRVSG